MRVVVKDLWKVYRGGVAALRGVSFELSSDRLIILAGPNGAGKTTLIRIIDGELSPSRGFVTVDGLSPDEAKARGFFGVMPQEAELHEYLSVREYLYYLALIKGLSRSEARAEVSRLIEDFMLEEYSSTRIEKLSGGYKKRVLLAQAFIGSPPLLILDEPTVGLDPEMRARLWGVVMRYVRGYGAMAILVTHYLDEVKRFADRVLLLHRGRLVFNGSPSALLSRLGYRYRVRLRLGSGRLIDGLPVDRYTVTGDGVEVFVASDDELVALMRFVDAHRDLVAEFSIERPSLEESYMKLLAEEGRDRGDT